MLTKIENIVTWNNLKSVYSNQKLSSLIEPLEEELEVVDETSFFANLVNTSISKSQPFHRWVRYREGYAGGLVKEILNRYPIDASKDFVLDPMCGSGSTNVACQELGLDSVGLDVNPFAVLTTRVKSFRLTSYQVEELIRTKSKVLNLFSTVKPEYSNYDIGISKYFNKENFADLVKLKIIIKNLNDGYVHDFSKLVLLAIVEDCSDRKKDGNGLATRKSPIDDVLKRFVEQYDLMLSDLSKVQVTEASTLSFCVSAKKMNESIAVAKSTFNKTLGSVIFSPPYANSFDYFESYKLEIVFGEYCLLENLFSFRQELIRNYRLSNKQKFESSIEIVNLLAKEIKEKIPMKEALTGNKDGRTRLVPNMLAAYFEDMSEVLQNCYLNLRQGGTVHIVVDQSSYVGVPIPTDNILALIGVHHGFEVLSVIRCRRAATSGQQLKQFPFLKDLLRETIVSLVKNGK